jgi:CheY-like chemotaxis protein
VTGRVALEEQLRHAAKMEAIGTLAAGLAHDFNNYLTVLGMHLDALDASAPAELAPTVAGARHVAEQCAEFTRQLLTFARKESTAMRELDLVALTRETVRLIRPLVGEAIDVELRARPAHLAVHGDASQLEGALVNLAANARDAMPRGGRLVLELDAVTLERGDAALEAECVGGPYARLRVVDTGRGIAPEDLPRIFEPYFSTKPSGRATGLGLATVYGSIRSHQGSVRVESKLGQGTAFEVYLPLTRDPFPRASADGPRPQTHALPADRIASCKGDAPALRGRVLVVEDMEPLRALAIEVLTEAGAHAESAEDGVSALERIVRGERFDLVITDLTMPRMSGTELARAVAERSPTTRVVFMTGYVEPSLHERLRIEHPGTALLKKPFRAEALLRAVSEMLPAR